MPQSRRKSPRSHTARGSGDQSTETLHICATRTNAADSLAAPFHRVDMLEFATCGLEDIGLLPSVSDQRSTAVPWRFLHPTKFLPPSFPRRDRTRGGRTWIHAARWPDHRRSNFRDCRKARSRLLANEYEPAGSPYHRSKRGYKWHNADLDIISAARHSSSRCWKRWPTVRPRELRFLNLLGFACLYHSQMLGDQCPHVTPVKPDDGHASRKSKRPFRRTVHIGQKIS